MRVLIINKFLYPNGGSETYIFKIGEALEQHGHEVQYFGMEHEGRCVGNRVNAYIPVLNIVYLVFDKLCCKIKEKLFKEEHFIDNDVLNCQLHGCFLVFSNLYLEDGICDKTFLYGEEDILMHRCREKGYTTLYYPEIKVQHNESRATKKSVPNIIMRKKFYYKHRMDSLHVLLECFEKEIEDE